MCPNTAYAFTFVLIDESPAPALVNHRTRPEQVFEIYSTDAELGEKAFAFRVIAKEVGTGSDVVN